MVWSHVIQSMRAELSTVADVLYTFHAVLVVGYSILPATSLPAIYHPLPVSQCCPVNCMSDYSKLLLTLYSSSWSFFLWSSLSRSQMDPIKLSFSLLKGFTISSRRYPNFVKVFRYMSSWLMLSINGVRWICAASYIVRMHSTSSNWFSSSGHTVLD